MLSVLIVVKNEAANIERAIGAVIDHCAEVVVVDTGSTDATVLLAKAAGARVLHSLWLGYGPTKNWAAEQCRYDWIWSIDADEAPDAALLAAVAKTSFASADTVYGMRRVTNYCGHWVEHGAWGRDTVWRIYDRRTSRWDERPVHEKLVSAKDGPREVIMGRLLHYSYPTRESFAAKQEPYLALSVRALQEEGRQIGWTKQYVAPWWRGFRDFVLKGGWRDGRAGWEIARSDVAMVREKYKRAAARQGPLASSAPEGDESDAGPSST